MLQRQIAVKDVTRGDLILREGETSRVLYIIQKGTVKVIDQKADRIKQLGAGEYFGEESVLSIFGQKSPKTYVATSNVTLLGVSKETFDDEGESKQRRWPFSCLECLIPFAVTDLFGTVCEKIERKAGAQKKRKEGATTKTTETSSAVTTQTGTPDTASTNNSIFVLPMAFPAWNAPWN